MREANGGGDWDTASYLRFEKERLRPARDLIQALPDIHPERIVDLGCGAGNVTPLLMDRFPDAALEGVDSSAAMLDKARTDGPSGVAWTQADIAAWAGSDGAPVGLIYSNAALHWLGSHKALFPRLIEKLTPGGVLAVQMPDNFTAPSHARILRVLEEMGLSYRPRWAVPPVAAMDEYYDWLAPHCRSVDLWKTTYMHRLAGKTAVRDFVSGSALRPVLDAIGPDRHEDFVSRLDALYATAYPRRDDRSILFPFRRMFMVARRA